MKTEIEQKTNTKLKARVEIPASVVDEKMEEIYRTMVKEVKLPGFRRGKVPRSLLEARYGRDIFDEDTQSALIREYLPQALKQLKVEPVAEPDTEVIEFDRGTPFKFRVEVEVLPELKLPNYTDIEVEDPGPPEPTEEEIEEEIKHLKRENAILVPKEGGVVSSGDLVVLSDVESGEEFELEISEDHEISSKLVGKSEGQVVNLEDYDTQIKILAVKEVELPTREELAHQLGHDSGKELRKEVVQKLTQTNKQRHQEELSLKILDKIISGTQLEIPQGMVDRIIEDNVKAIQEARNDSSFKLIDLLEERGLTEDEYREEVKKETRRNLVLKEIKKAEGIKIEDDELEEIIEEEAKKKDINPLKFKNLLKVQQGGLENFKEQKENEIALDLLREKANIVAGG